MSYIGIDMTKISENDKLNLALESWKKAIDVQQHFNEICMKIRNFYISLTTALLALAGVLMKSVDNKFVEIGIFDIHILILFLLILILSTILFYFIDRHWYHRLLVGAVKHALMIEKALGETAPSIKLTTSIGDESPMKVGRFSAWRVIGFVLSGDKRVWCEGAIHSDAKLSIFYKSIIYAFLIIIVLFSFLGGVKKVDQITAINIESTGVTPNQIEDVSSGSAGTK